ncbi:hypothetical protein [Acidimangrovimonas sediminis]|uniref:hypothetical protein n=1 Tax=Acidimangrovimonas sediminis TaxID=2056283 RepID=UPI000C7FCAD4|nr:hypothetical protein [Acidimangrovimonas sediminis]
MQICYLAFFANPADPGLRIAEAELAALRACLAGLKGLDRGHLYTPSVASDRYNDDGAPPVFGFQLYFDDIADMEAALREGGALQSFVTGGGLASLDGTEASHQAMLARPFAVPDPQPPVPGACSYLVHYPGPAEDLSAWLGHYVAHHPPLMVRFPGLRQLEILTRLDWIDAMPWPRVAHMQRNRILFDSPDALTAALQSPVREEMRGDYNVFPAYEGGNKHFPMLTEVVRPR